MVQTVVPGNWGKKKQRVLSTLQDKKLNWHSFCGLQSIHQVLWIAPTRLYVIKNGQSLRCHKIIFTATGQHSSNATCMETGARMFLCHKLPFATEGNDFLLLISKLDAWSLIPRWKQMIVCFSQSAEGCFKKIAACQLYIPHLHCQQTGFAGFAIVAKPDWIQLAMCVGGDQCFVINLVHVFVRLGARPL